MALIHVLGRVVTLDDDVAKLLEAAGVLYRERLTGAGESRLRLSPDHPDFVAAERSCYAEGPGYLSGYAAALRATQTQGRALFDAAGEVLKAFYSGAVLCSARDNRSLSNMEKVWEKMK